MLLNRSPSWRQRIRFRRDYVELRLRVKTPRSPGVSATSEAEGRPDLPRTWLELRFLAISRHWLTFRANKDREWVADLNVDRPNAEQRPSGGRDRARLPNAHASPVKNLHRSP